MKVTTHSPHVALRDFIEAFVVLEVKENETIKDFYPTNAALMCFDITQKHFRFGDPAFHFTDAPDTVSLCFVGVLDHYYPVESIPRKVLQVVFSPYGAYHFFRMEMPAFTNSGVNALLVRTDIRDTVTQMEDAHLDTFGCIQLLENYFLNRLSKGIKTGYHSPNIQVACNKIIQHSGNVRIRDLCRHVHMSENRFRVHFNEIIGISPKIFCRIEKLKQINRILCNDKSADWMALCHGFHFFDQAHFIREFKAHFGCTPTAFLKK